MLRSPGRSAAWLAHLLWEQEVGGSNPPAPTPVPFPQVSGLQSRIDYPGSRPKITPHHTRPATSDTRRARTGGTQQERLAARLAEIQLEDLSRRLREIERTL